MQVTPLPKRYRAKFSAGKKLLFFLGFAGIFIWYTQMWAQSIIESCYLYAGRITKICKRGAPYGPACIAHKKGRPTGAGRSVHTGVIFF
ncbi:MAG: hypothetical protein DBY17_06350 [Oscillospiraceae bacterium]|jgi:hypothetical protein|nr:MAG: hypothetical protein DBY17_06350 [Oscillospiraceae bacterium]